MLDNGELKLGVHFLCDRTNCGKDSYIAELPTISVFTGTANATKTFIYSYVVSSIIHKHKHASAYLNMCKY